MKAPGPSTLQFINGMRKHGFLDYVGQLWREYGDVFQVNIGTRSILFAITIILLSPYYSHRHPEFWQDAKVFDPDRWARPAEANSPAFHPFGSGPRVCIGNSFSLLESHLLLAILAQRFAPRLSPSYKAQWEMQGVLNLAGGLPMQIVAR